MDDAFDVPDSTDWLGTPLACLLPVEQAFRCHVCKDFFNSPMLTSCNHTFCSLCIRRSLAVEGKCPLCRASDQESKLRGNWAMREAVDAFIKSRSTILQFARTPPAPVASGSPKRKADDLDGQSRNTPDGKRPRMSTRSSKAKAAETTAAMMRDEVDVPEDKELDMDDYVPDDGLVSCPICLSRMKEAQVDRHLDTSCPGSPQPQTTEDRTTNLTLTTTKASQANSFMALQQSMGTSPATARVVERLPTLAYSMMKETALRKKLVDLGISNAGNKQMLERRHREWVMLWNANCDSSHPKKRSELLQDLETWERTMGTRAPMMSRAANLGTQIKDKDFDGAAWAAKHDTSFKDLIANARKSKRQAEVKAKGEPEVEKKEPVDAGYGQASIAAALTESGVNPQPQSVVDLTTPGSSQTEQAEVRSTDFVAPPVSPLPSSQYLSNLGEDAATFPL